MTKKASTPDTFDFAEWFGGNAAPEESVDIFTATHLVGEINRLQRLIEEQDRVAGAVEKSLSDEMSPEEEELAALLEVFLASRRTVFVRGLDQDERTAIRKAHEASRQPPEDFSRRCLSASIVALQKPGEDRTPTRLTLSAVEKLHKQIGEGQMAEIFRTYQQATSGLPTVDADFLHRRSGRGQENTEES